MCGALFDLRAAPPFGDPQETAFDLQTEQFPWPSVTEKCSSPAPTTSYRWTYGLAIVLQTPLHLIRALQRSVILLAMQRIHAPGRA